ncbi:MAG: hypothetical protein P1V97_32115, partial [Planctomycetota bacterium]|nr:hypothetical protein [Planctomycetota bacterium]
MLRKACLLTTCLIAVMTTPALAQSSVEGTWKLAKDEKTQTKAAYYVIEAKDEGNYTGRRIPAYTYLKTEINLVLKDGKLNGQILYMDTKKESPWSTAEKCPKAKWEFDVSDKELK